MRYYNSLMGRFTQKDLIFIDWKNYYLYSNNSDIFYFDPFGLSFCVWIERLWRKFLGKQTIGEVEYAEDPASCAQEYYYCEEDCVKCCEKKFPVATANPLGACSTKRIECIIQCVEVTYGKCESPPGGDENGQK